MAISQYSELTAAVANWLNRSDLTSRIPEFISMAEDYVAQELRIRAMETSVDITIDAQTEALPTRYLETIRLYIDGDPVQRLRYMKPLDFWERWTSSRTGKPQFFTIEGENYVFGPAPDSTYTGKCLYFQRFAAMSADGDTNWILSNARGLYLYRALLEAAPFIGDDPRSLTWAALWDDLAEKVKKADKTDRTSGDAKISRTAVTVR